MLIALCLIGGYFNGKIRAVTNLHISREDIEYTVSAVRELLA